MRPSSGSVCTNPEEGLTEGRSIEEECADVHLMHVIYRKLRLETLDAEEHHAGTEAVQPQNKFVYYVEVILCI